MADIKINLITWTLVCIGWVASNFVGYMFGARRYGHERAEQVFEEVSVIIESSQRISEALTNSLGAHEEPARREGLWSQYEDLQNRYYGNRCRYQYLLNKYFGNDIATHVDSIMGNKLPDITRESCEKDGAFPEDIVAYYEAWTGGGSQDPLGEADGYKWKMMAICGMNVTPYIKELRRIQEEERKNFLKVTTQDPSLLTRQ